MLNILHSTSEQPNQRFSRTPRPRGEDNLAWMERVLDGDDLRGVYLVLLGGTDRVSQRLRAAQAQLRHDLSPSHWSHVGLMTSGVASTLEETVVHEISMDPPGGFGFPAPTNGVQEGSLGSYRDERRFPNVALLRLPVERKVVEKALARFKEQRILLDATELVIVWLAYLWGAGRAANPLLEGSGIPSSAMIETVLSTSGYELTPGLESRASCPEAIWQAARWWHQYYSGQDVAPPSGGWFTPSKL